MSPHLVMEAVQFGSTKIVLKDIKKLISCNSLYECEMYFQSQWLKPISCRPFLDFLKNLNKVFHCDYKDEIIRTFTCKHLL